jgi:exopolysaccharide production protein ExoZ
VLLTGRGKLLSVQCLRGIAVLLVLYFHVTEVARHYLGAKIGGSFSAFGNAGVDLFFVISGFVVVGVARKVEGAGLRHALEFAYDRAARIYPIYWIYSILLIAPFLVNPNWVNSLARMHGLGDYVLSFLLLPNDTSPVLLVGWTLVFEIFFYFVVSVGLLLRARLSVVLVCWVIALVAFDAAKQGNWTVSPVVSLLSSPLSLEFILGAGISYLFVRTFKPQTAAIMLGCVIVSVAILCKTLDLPRDDIDPWFRVCAYGPVCVVSLMAVMSLEESFQSPRVAWLVLIGDASYSIYLSHTLILSGAGRLLQSMFPGRLAFFLELILAAACIVVGLLSYRYLEKRLLRYSKSLKQLIFSTGLR